MKIGIISDTHDNVWNIDKVIEIFKEKGIKTLIHCGDLCAPFVIVRLGKSGLQSHCVFGNTDDRYATPKKAAEFENVHFYGNEADFELEGRKISVTHYPRIAKALAANW